MISFLSFASPSASIAAFATTFAPAFSTNVSSAFKDWPVEMTSSTRATLFPLIFCASILFKYNFWEPLVVIETKGSTDKDKRRDVENLKIDCGKKHFEALQVDYADCVNITDFKKEIDKVKEKNQNN